MEGNKSKIASKLSRKIPTVIIDDDRSDAGIVWRFLLLRLATELSFN